MLTRDELVDLLVKPESFRVEKSTSTTNMDKFCEAICAFANDLPDSRRPGYLLLGVTDDGKCSGLKVTDELQKKIAAIRVDGNILPMPVMNLQVFNFPEGDVLVVEVQPALLPPVRYRGRTFVRIGPRKDLATREEEDILTQRNSYHFPTMDSTPCTIAKLDDLDLDLFEKNYLPKAVASDLLVNSRRTPKDWLIALRLYNRERECPTYAGILLCGKDPLMFMHGAYVQYVRWGGKDNASPILNQRIFEGNLCTLLPQLDTFIDMAIVQKRPIPVSALREEIITNYPKWAIRELLMNAVMHRDYMGNAPIRFYQYPDRIEIMNHGGLYGRVRPENFPNINDYRNPDVAVCIRTLGYVNMLNHGIPEVQRQLVDNGNGPAIFSFDKITAFEAVIPLSQTWIKLEQEEAAQNAVSQMTVGVHEERGQKTEECGQKTEEYGQKTKDRILKLLRSNPKLSKRDISSILSIAVSAISRHVADLKQAGRLRRVGPDKGGYWEVIGE